MDQQLQEGLSLSQKIRVDAEARARSSDLIWQKRTAEIPEVLRLDAFQELLQSRRLL